ncbi:capsular polysaccharide synthesis protein [Bifidobacterium crudilactis]|uniref:capsular polysaccharide synthesis protein n=1 Tax=Bifidobacterium crudilactis TaxID=327277 RepID=UPI00069220DC|nr:capsular polysaccharide synthesis protein [Bifidobacterium crudilactis]
MMSTIRRRLLRLMRYATDVSPLFLGIIALNYLAEVTNRILGTPYSTWINQQRNREFQRFLRREFGPFTDGWKGLEETAVAHGNISTAPIWMCWLQGEQNAPPFIATLIANTKAHAGTHPVHVVSLDTINQYVDISPRVLELYRQHNIGAAHFTDYIRFALLEQYGGCWLDATVLLTAPLPDEIFTRPFWNATGLNPNFPMEPKCVDITVWESYFMAAQPHSLLFKFLKAIYTEYFNRYDMVLEYLLINHFAKIAREDIPTISKEFNQLPPNNTECEMLRPQLEQAPTSQFWSLLTTLPRQTTVYKLSSSDSYARPDRMAPFIEAVESLRKAS